MELKSLEGGLGISLRTLKKRFDILQDDENIKLVKDIFKDIIKDWNEEQATAKDTAEDTDEDTAEGTDEDTDEDTVQNIATDDTYEDDYSLNDDEDTAEDTDEDTVQNIATDDTYEDDYSLNDDEGDPTDESTLADPLKKLNRQKEDDLAVIDSPIVSKEILGKFKSLDNKKVTDLSSYKEVYNDLIKLTSELTVIDDETDNLIRGIQRRLKDFSDSKIK